MPRAGQQAHLSRWLLLAGLFAGLALRLYHLGAESLWYDETVSVYLARLPVPDMLAHTAGDIHPPGYYLLLHLWQLAAHPTLAHGLEFLFAWFSLLAGMLSLPMLYALGRRLFNPRVGVLALWCAALNPWQIWYSQEVRMYTLGSLLGLVCLWAVLNILDPPSARRQRGGWLAVYVAAAVAGIYTLYYFALLLVAFNLLVPLLLWRTRGAGIEARHAFIAWLAAQGAVLLLWLPWLPNFWRQLTEPPVPPWRVPWATPGEVAASLSETLAAPLAGQSPPLGIAWPWALLTIAFLLGFVLLAARPARQRTPGAATLLLLYMGVPVLLLYALTATVTPIYHVRYLFIYLAPSALLMGAVLDGLLTRWRWVGVFGLVTVFVVSSLSLREFWTSPRYRPDDHRGAVAHLAREWRPSDAILVNAGWAYTILDAYWPAAPGGDGDLWLPPLNHSTRLLDYANNDFLGSADAPFALRTGSVDGDPSLGWGSPTADFFATSAGATQEALAHVAAEHPRIWHYRLYDTVSDPQGAIRTWLATNTTPLREYPIPGRDFGMLQLFATNAIVDTPHPLTPDQVTFGDALTLAGHSAAPTTPAGTQLYVDLLWHPLPALAGLPADLSVSLRLYDDAGALVAQTDGPPLPATSTWTANLPVRHAAALHVPSATSPGTYRLELVVYRQDDGAALPLPDHPRTRDGQRWQLGTVDVTPAP